MKEIIIAPLVLSVIIGLAFELVETAESASDKVLAYTQDMENALDCAFAGVPIEVCSPGLAQTSFKEDLQELNRTNQELIELTEDELKAYLEDGS
ncbi:MAG: hypothetical protein ACOC32_04785 [Nanoarchaeota archaeon]